MRSASVLRTFVVGCALALTVTACTSNQPTAAGGSTAAGTVPAPSTSASTSASVARTSARPSTPATSPKPTPLGKPVKVSSVEGDGGVYGVGMPLVVRFSVSPTDKKAFEAAAKVSVNGVAVKGAWFWEKPYADSPTEVHYRMETYWPARAKIHVDLPVKGASAGKGLSFANSLTLDYSIGAYHYARVDAKTLRMSVYSDAKLVKLIPVSLGKGNTPTYSGTKVVMQKDNPVRMIGPGYNELVAWSVRLTTSGEYVHAAPWNSRIGQTSTSNGCTNLSVADAAWFYNFSILGDIVQYPNASPDLMPSWDGYGDWNVSWSIWQGGGKL